MDRVLALSSVAVVVVLGSSAVAPADILASNPIRPDFTTLYYENAWISGGEPGFFFGQSADGFALAQESVVTDVTFAGRIVAAGCFYKDLTNISHFRVMILSDAGGVPGAVVHEQLFTKAQTNPVLAAVLPDTFNLYTHSAAFSSPPTLPAGNYWVSVMGIYIIKEFCDHWGWAQGTVTGHARRSEPDGAWQQVLVSDSGLTYEIIGYPVVPPATFVRRVAAVGDILPGTPGLACESLNDPYTDGYGVVGFTGRGTGDNNFVWYDDRVIWLNSEAAPAYTLTGAEGTMDVGNGGRFIYSPSIDGNDGVWTQAGYLLADNDPAPGFAKFSTFNSRPGMAPNGVAYWVAGLSDTATSSTNQRVLYRVPNPANPVFSAVLVGGQTYAGLTITATGINFAYDADDSGLWFVNNLTNTGPTANDVYLMLTGPNGSEVIAREGFFIPGSNNESFTSTFRIPSVNWHGDVAYAGDTNAATDRDEVLVYKDVVRLREGDVVDGVPLAGASGLGGTVIMVSLNNCGQIAHLWDCGTATTDPERLFFGPGEDLKNSSRLLLSTGDEIDFDGDGICDGVVTDFNASSVIAPGLDLANDGMIYVHVDVQPCGGGSAVEMIIGIRAYCPSDWDASGF
ncbi:MAG TPA: hypothetical protein PKU91_03960, partial [Phycisphaerales bacterium]|nr:hypothetical protein [Phycisphaerales bacterium]